jgi:hypothetical protein
MSNQRDRDSAARLCSPSVPEPDAWAVTIGPTGNSSVYEAFAAHQKDEAEALARECLFGDSSRPLPLAPLYFAPRWIPASERLPDAEKSVLVCYMCGLPRIYIGLRRRGNHWSVPDAGTYDTSLVTHWMPLPEPPQ